MNTTQWCAAVWEQFRSLPWRVQAALVLALVLLFVAWPCFSLLRRRGGGSR